MRRGLKFKNTLVTALVLAIAGLASPAAAQQSDGFMGSDIPFNPAHGDGVPVTSRPHPELDPNGIRTGSMILFPTVQAGVGYTNNVYGATSGDTGDGYEVLSPSATLVSQWSRHSLEFDAGAGFKRFMSQSTRNETAYSLQTSGRIDLGTGDDNIVALVHHMRGFEAQYSGAFPNNAAGTVGYYQTEGILRGTFGVDRVRMTASGKVNDLNYSDTPSLSGGVIDQQYRNRTEYQSTVRIEYGFPADAIAFSEASYSIVDYHTATLTQPLRSNHTTRVLIGGNFKITPLIRVMAGVGYERRDYDAQAYASISGTVADMRVEWLPTELMTVNIQVSRKVEDAIYVNSPGYFAAAGRIRVDHELLRYVTLFGEVNYERDAYVATSRTDRQTQVIGGANYALNRHVKLQPSIRYIDRTSIGYLAGQSFKELRGEMDLIFNW